MLQSVNQVMQRISNIERRFSPSESRKAVSSNFATTLASATTDLMDSGKATAFNPSAKQGDIAKMVHLAANKHGVDPKLAMAVAEAESGLSANVVSPVGAVGVMQLMPETARSLDVRNITDPYENIDGGVRYLKQMLTMFGGDVTKAVAAYNAGPQAVKNYNGVPPYSETRNYVARVLSLAK
ncbi:lytic transglycosylase domain-containing protein [Sporomusa malonica]|uniref:Transglycosylase SLT domain-containing protein n=1 Tax=Sporomusa malonica TaxID=112901 RepID=A0A1W2AZ58_9FIRM|nr:lytic transglycosylase domain-containing protein [Sporomusa malonica]SMC65966.1 Transglycosylase SLT domain-containing protein [Sporomusa malonica]